MLSSQFAPGDSNRRRPGESILEAMVTSRGRRSRVSLFIGTFS
jgi:hypothetical protein